MMEGKVKSKIEEITIYERLAPGECLIISRDEKGILVACNKNGELEIKKIPYPKE